MTSAGAAAIFGKDRLNVVTETPVERAVQFLDGDSSGGGLFARFELDGCRAIGYWNEQLVFNANHGRIARSEFESIGELADQLIVMDPFGQESLARFRAGEDDVRGNNGKLVCNQCLR